MVWVMGKEVKESLPFIRQLLHATCGSKYMYTHYLLILTTVL